MAGANHWLHQETNKDREQAKKSKQTDNLEKTKTILGAADVSNGAKENIIAMDKVANASKYAKGVRLLGKGLAFGQVGLELNDAYTAYADPNMSSDAKMDVYVKTFVGASVTTAEFAISGPVGWVMGASYFIADVAGLWNNSVMMPNTYKTPR